MIPAEYRCATCNGSSFEVATCLGATIGVWVCCNECEREAEALTLREAFEAISKKD